MTLLVHINLKWSDWRVGIKLERPAKRIIITVPFLEIAVEYGVELIPGPEDPGPQPPQPTQAES